MVQTPVAKFQCVRSPPAVPVEASGIVSTSTRFKRVTFIFPRYGIPGRGREKESFFPFVQGPDSFSRLLEKYTPCDKDPPSLLRSVGSESSGRSLTLVSHIFFQEKRTKQKKIRIIKGQSQPRAPANLREKIKSCSAVVFLLLLHFPRVMRARETEGCELEIYTMCSDFQGRTRGII